MNKENLTHIQLNKKIKTKCITTNVSEEISFQELLDIYKSVNKSEIAYQLFADKNTAYDALIFSMVHHTKLHIENQEINLTKLKNRILEFICLHSYAVTVEQKFHAQSSLAYFISLRIPSEYSSIEAAMNTYCCEIAKEDQQNIFRLIEAEQTKNSLFLKATSSVVSPVIRRDNVYGEDLAELILKDQPGIHIFCGRMGLGKTERLIKPVFNTLSEQGQFPILCTAKRILAKNLVDDFRHYQSPSFGFMPENSSMTSHNSGVCIVVNSLSQRKFQPITISSHWLLLEELEDILAQATGDAVGDGTLKAKQIVINSLLNQIIQSKHIIVADAFISEHSYQLLQKLTKLPVYFYPGAECTNSAYPTVNLYPNEAQFIANLVDDLKAGKRVLLFTDCSKQTEHSKFQQLYEYLDTFSCHSLVIDADSVQEMGCLSFWDTEYQLVMISPVITSGFSIERDLFDKVYVLGKQTIHPNQLLQTLFRYRRAETIELHLSNNYFTRSTPQSFMQILIDELSRTPTSDLTEAEVDDYKQSLAVKILIERKQIEQQVRSQYFNNFLKLLQIHQFPLKRITADEDHTTKGKNHLNLMEKKLRDPWRSRPVSDYISLLNHKNKNQLSLGDNILLTFLVTLLNKLNINHTTLNGVCSGTEFTDVMNWIATGKISLDKHGLSRPVQLILQKSGLKINVSTRKKKSMINIILKHYFGIIAEDEESRENDLRTGRPWHYRISKFC